MAALVVTWPLLFGGGRLERRQILRLEALVSWTEALRDTIAGHASLEHAIPATAPAAQPAIQVAIARLVGQIEARVPLDLALRGLADDLDDPDADHIIAALILNVHRRGDRLADVLTSLAMTAREGLDLRRRVLAGRAGTRRAVQIVILLTVVVALFLIVLGSTYLQPYDSVSGQAALAVVLSAFAVGFAWMRHLSGVDPGTPFLERRRQGAIGVRSRQQDLNVVKAIASQADAGVRGGGR